MVSLEITKVGDSLAVVLPREVLARLKVSEGDTLFLRETSGGYQMFSHGSELQEQLKLAREIMEQHRDVLGKLAGS